MQTVELISGDVVLRGTVTGAAPTVLMLHAGGERRTVWEPVAAMLERGGVCSVFFDQRGHGESSGEPSTLAKLTDDVRAMVGRERTPVTLVGASIGGLAAIDALADPTTAGSVAGLVLVDVVPDPHPARVRAWLDERGLRARHAELVEDVLARGPALRATLAAMDLPVLLVRGGTASPLTDADIAGVRAANPATAVVEVPGAGHLIARDAPDQLAPIILDRARAWHRLRYSRTGE